MQTFIYKKKNVNCKEFCVTIKNTYMERLSYRCLGHYFSDIQAKKTTNFLPTRVSKEFVLQHACGSNKCDSCMTNTVNLGFQNVTPLNNSYNCVVM